MVLRKKYSTFRCEINVKISIKHTQYAPILRGKTKKKIIVHTAYYCVSVQLYFLFACSILLRIFILFFVNMHRSTFQFVRLKRIKFHHDMPNNNCWIEIFWRALKESLYSVSPFQEHFSSVYWKTNVQCSPCLPSRKTRWKTKCLLYSVLRKRAKKKSWQKYRKQKAKYN